jgi:ankyrin repeat protein
MLQAILKTGDTAVLYSTLKSHPELANEGVPLDDTNPALAHPLHRIADWIFTKDISEEKGIELAEILLDFGANIDGLNLKTLQDTPIIAAASLYANQLAKYYLTKGANLDHQGCFGGTALHWAAWCGGVELLEVLLQQDLDLNQKCIEFKSTPLFWAVHGTYQDKNMARNAHLKSIELLVNAGVDKNIPNLEGYTIFDLAKDDEEVLRILNRH